MLAEKIFGHSFGRSLRTRRLFRHGDGRIFIVPLDHSVSDGPITPGIPLDELVSDLATSQVDAVVLHKGSLRHVRHERFADMALIVHLSASTRHAPDPDAKYLVATVEEAVRAGADAVSVHVNVGSVEEARQVADMATVSDACDRWNIPMLAMMYPRGPKVVNPKDPALIAHAAQLAADLGADIVKSVHPGTVPDLLDITRMCPVPFVAAGGASLSGPDEVVDYVVGVLRGGGAGVAMGRNIFQSPDPAGTAARVVDVLHPRQPAAIERLERPLVASA